MRTSVPDDRPVKLVNAGTGQVLEAAPGGALADTWRRSANDASQQWRFSRVDGREHLWELTNVDTRASLTEDMTLAVDGVAGRWRVIPVAEREFAIVSAATGRALSSAVDDSSYYHDPRQRWKITAGHAERPTRAVFTLVRDEEVFLPIWLRYYSRFFAPQDIHVLDHGGADRFADEYGFTRIAIDQPVFGAEWQRETIQRHQHDLLDRYDVVLFADADEIIAPEPCTGDLGDYLDNFDEDFVTCQGYEVLHLADSEPAFDPGQPVLAQRKHWYRNEIYSKSLIARVPSLWNLGFHQRLDQRRNVDPLLYLLHLHRMDYEICLDRHKNRAAFPRAEKDRARGWGYQNRITDPDGFREWFYQDSCGGGTIQPEEIPSRWRGMV
ncbi:glycosyltransferase family 2 protein [Lentzea sp. NPDC004782]|uniref:glycosyltransferase family 2 protein n=1 Tax=Lentzea sp. NPDC004782 TaxID=3154458 RepID=UPI0033A8E331